MVTATTPGYDAGYFRNARPEMQPFVPAQVACMLEIGCGEGAFGAYCKQARGCECWGIEYNIQAAERARARLDRVVTGDALDAARQLPDRTFDLIVCNDVLEHMAEPEVLLRELVRVLKPDGAVLASIPNLRYYKALITIVARGDFPREDHGIFDRTHLRFFTRKVIERTFNESGYRIERLEGINGSRSNGLRVANWLSFGALADCRYLQFACLARPRDH